MPYVILICLRTDIFCTIYGSWISAHNQSRQEVFKCRSLVISLLIYFYLPVARRAITVELLEDLPMWSKDCLGHPEFVGCFGVKISIHQVLECWTTNSLQVYPRDFFDERNAKNYRHLVPRLLLHAPSQAKTDMGETIFLLANL